MAGWHGYSPHVKRRVLAWIRSNPGIDEAELIRLEGGGVVARLRIGDYLPLLRTNALATRDAEGRWWAT